MISRELRTLAEGVRLLCSPAFWRAFHDYWFGGGLWRRLDAWAARRRRFPEDYR